MTAIPSGGGAYQNTQFGGAQQGAHKAHRGHGHHHKAQFGQDPTQGNGSTAQGVQPQSNGDSFSLGGT